MDPLTNQWIGPNPVLMWGRGFLCISPGMLILLIGFQKDWGDIMSSPVIPKVVDKINRGVKRIKITQRLLPHPVKKACNTHASPLPTWGQIKKLAAEGEELL
jgi:hypothetical protein